MSEKIDTRVVQVTNLAPSCTMEQLRTLFSYLGRVKELQMFPPESVDINAVTVRVAYIEFDDVSTTGVSLHLNGTVFVDRALVIVPVMDGKIPDESTAMRLTPQAVAGMLPGQPTWPANVVSQMTGTGANQVITTFDPKLTSLGLPQYPPLPASIDPNIIEEIRRTVYVSNLDSKVSGEELVTFFSQAGEVKFVRMAGDDAAYVEFTDQRSVAQALALDQTVFQGDSICVQHSKTQIIKPQGKDSPSRSKRTRSRSKGSSQSRSRVHRSRSRSKGRKRRSRSRSPRRRSRSRHRSPRRSRSPRRRRSRSRGRRSRSRDRRRSRTRSPVVVRKRRSRSGSRRKRSRTPPKSYSNKRSRSRSRKRSGSRSRKRSRSRDRKVKERKKSPSLSPPRLERNGSIPPTDGSPARRDSRSVSPGPLRSRRRSPSPRKRSRSRSPNRRIKRRRRPSRSPSPKRRSRSRSGSRHKSKRDRGKRSRSRDRKHESKKKSSRDKEKEEKRKESSSSKTKQVKRDYDEEEKGYGSGSEKDRAEASDDSAASAESPPQLDTMDKEDHQTVDMDMSD